MNHSNKTINKYAFGLISILLVAYTYYRLLNITTGDENSNSSIVTLQGVFLLIIEGVSFVSVIGHLEESHNPLYNVFLLWSLWIFFDFFVFGLRGDGLSNFFLALPCPFLFFFFNNACKNEDIREGKIVLLFLIIFLYSGYICITTRMGYMALYRGDDPYLSNLIFWPLCTVPFVFLLKRQTIKWLFLIVLAALVVLTGKRSATIVILVVITLHLIFSVAYEIKNKKNRNRLIWGIIIAGLVFYVLLNKYLTSDVAILSDRFSTVTEDEGSGRLSIYWDVFNHMDDFTFFDYIVGKGYNSIFSTGHTNAHNDALQVFFEYGFVGLVFYIIISVRAIKRLFFVRKVLPQYYSGYMASIVIYVVLGLVSNLYSYNTYFMFICVYWGMVEGVIARKNKEINLCIR